MLERAGCDEIQGYLFSRPLPEADVIPLLQSMPALAELWPGPDVHLLPRLVDGSEHFPEDLPRGVVQSAMTATCRR
jgi:hypothetical protein